MSQRMSLLAALTTVSVMVPEARSVELAIGDHDIGHGFVIFDVGMTDMTRLSQTDPGLLLRIRGEVSHLLSDIEWDGVVGEDEDGYATHILGRG